jgi:hypothetical protein
LRQVKCYGLPTLEASGALNIQASLNPTRRPLSSSLSLLPQTKSIPKRSTTCQKRSRTSSVTVVRPNLRSALVSKPKHAFLTGEITRQAVVSRELRQKQQHHYLEATSTVDDEHVEEYQFITLIAISLSATRISRSRLNPGVNTVCGRPIGISCYAKTQRTVELQVAHGTSNHVFCIMRGPSYMTSVSPFSHRSCRLRQSKLAQQHDGLRACNTSCTHCYSLTLTIMIDKTIYWRARTRQLFDTGRPLPDRAFPHG